MKNKRELVVDKVIARKAVRILRYYAGAFDGEDLSPGQALLVWLAGVLASTVRIPGEAQENLLAECSSEIINFGNSLETAVAAGEKELPVCVVMILDDKFCGVSLRQGPKPYTDLTTGDRVDLPVMPLEVISYNMTALYTDRRAMYLKEHANAKGTG